MGLKCWSCCVKYPPRNFKKSSPGKHIYISEKKIWFDFVVGQKSKNTWIWETSRIRLKILPLTCPMQKLSRTLYIYLINLLVQFTVSESAASWKSLCDITRGSFPRLCLLAARKISWQVGSKYWLLLNKLQIKRWTQKNSRFAAHEKDGRWSRPEQEVCVTLLWVNNPTKYLQTTQNVVFFYFFPSPPSTHSAPHTHLTPTPGLLLPSSLRSCALVIWPCRLGSPLWGRGAERWR